jgi:starvation-inducible outer membrane lipoprotein
MIHNNRIFQFLTAVLGSTILLGTACTKIPQEGSIAPDITYKNRKQYAISGLQLNIGSFQSSTSTLPLKFEIMEIREPGGKPVSALTDEIPVIRYKEAITGNESAAELALKSDTVMVPAVSINEYTGVLEIQEGNKIPAGEYHFDIQVSNQSGSKLLTDALVVEFKEQDVISWSSGMAKQPEIERVGDAPNQIRFVAYLDGQPLPGDYIDFTKDRAAGFKGTFVDDTDDGEIWNVNFPVKEADTYATWKVVTEVGGVEQVNYESYNFDFVIGIPGSYVVRLYK